MADDLNRAWLQALADVLHGDPVAPRGQPTLERLHRTLTVDMLRPVLTVPSRKLSYQFMAAEAFWILSGDDTVAGIAPWNKEIRKFSDDGQTFFGSYGPKVVGQLPYVVEKLLSDPDSRQAGLTIWRESPPATKDVPCTVALFFSLRGEKLHTHAFMRSSDQWLGIVYDVFNFAMISHAVCARLNHARLRADCGASLVQPGTLYLTAASAHLYQQHWAAARLALSSQVPALSETTPAELFLNEATLMNTLKALRDSKRGDPLRWWEAQP
jgi:thymidylate synthase